MKGTPKLSPLPPRELADDAISWAAGAGISSEIAQEVRVEARKRQRLRVALGGALGLVLLGATFWSLWPSARTAAPKVPASVLVLAPARQTLPDGTTVELKDGARLEPAFGPSERRIVLQAGEAHFQVAKDPSRPFIVVSGQVEVRAVGTAFSVSRDSREVAVLVTEGRVVVERATADASSAQTAPPPPVAIPLDAGKRLVVDLELTEAAPAVPETLAPAEQNQRLAWRVPMFEFSGTPLREVVRMFNDYGPPQLILQSSLSQLELSGVVRADDSKSLLTILRNEFGIESERKPGGELRLSRRDSSR